MWYMLRLDDHVRIFSPTMTSSDRCSLYLHRFGAYFKHHQAICSEIGVQVIHPLRLLLVLFSILCYCNVYWTWCWIKCVKWVGSLNMSIFALRSQILLYILQLSPVNKVGTLCKMKIETLRFANLFKLYLTEYTTPSNHLMFKMDPIATAPTLHPCT